MAAGVTTGVPILLEENNSGGSLFNRMYYEKEEELGETIIPTKVIFFKKIIVVFISSEHTFFSRVSCNFGEGAREGRYSTNRFPKKTAEKVTEKN